MLTHLITIPLENSVICIESKASNLFSAQSYLPVHACDYLFPLSVPVLCSKLN